MRAGSALTVRADEPRLLADVPRDIKTRRK